jgi:hypothetical protein
VVVTTPNNTHHAYTTAALNAGKHGSSNFPSQRSNDAVLLL